MSNYLNNIVSQHTPFGTINKICTWANGERGTLSIEGNAVYFNGNVIAQGFIPYCIEHRKGKDLSTMFGIEEESEELNIRSLAEEYYKMCIQDYKELHDDDDEAMLFKSEQEYQDKLAKDFTTFHYETEQNYLQKCELFAYISEEEARKIENRANTYLRYLEQKNPKVSEPKGENFRNIMSCENQDKEMDRIRKLLEGKTKDCDIAHIFTSLWSEGIINEKPSRGEYKDLMGKEYGGNWKNMIRQIDSPPQFPPKK